VTARDPDRQKKMKLLFGALAVWVVIIFIFLFFVIVVDWQ
jgi:hypothetical protein